MRKSTSKKLIHKVKNDYNKISETFSQTRQHSWPEFEFFQPYLEKLCAQKNTDPKIILDLGCGNGRLFKFIAPIIKNHSHINYLGIDISEGLLKQAKQQFPNQTFLLGNQIKIPLPPNSVDQIWNIAAFHHIPSPKLRAQALDEIFRVLKPNGYFLSTVWNLFQPKYQKAQRKALFKHLSSFGNYEKNDFFIPWHPKKNNDTSINNPTYRYYHSFTPKELTTLINQSSLDLQEIFFTRKNQKVTFKECFNTCIICQKQSYSSRKVSQILKIPIDQISNIKSLDFINQASHQKEQTQIITPNPEIILKSLKNKKYQKILQNSHLNLPDGAGLIWADEFQNQTQNTTSKITKYWTAIKLLIKFLIQRKNFNQRIKQRVTGTDTLNNFLEQYNCTNKTVIPFLKDLKSPKIFLLGAAPGVAQALKEKYQLSPNLQIVDTHSGSPAKDEAPKIIEKINHSKAQVLFVAFGAPKQEIWIHDHLPKMPQIKVAIGVGGAFDFLTNKINRAPKWMQQTGFEWLYRLIKQPTRIKRIYNAVIKFPIKVITS